MLHENEEISSLASDAISLFLSCPDENLSFWIPRSVSADGKTVTQCTKNVSSENDENSLAFLNNEELGYGAQFLKEILELLDINVDNKTQMTKIVQLRESGLASLEQEKRKVKNELRRFDNEWFKKKGSLPSKLDKEPLRPVYNYYKLLRTAISEKYYSKIAEKNVRAAETAQTPEIATRLQQELFILKDETKVIRNKLQEYREKFEKKYGRSIRFHKDVAPVQQDYNTYKKLKERIAKVTKYLEEASVSET